MSKTKMTYTEAIAEVEQILERFDSEEMNVDDLGASVKRAAELIRICKEKLRAAEDEVADALRDDSAAGKTDKNQPG